MKEAKKEVIPRSKNTAVDRKTGIISGQRKMLEIGGLLYVNVPREFAKKYNLKKGGIIAFTADTFLKYIPIE